MTATDTHRAIDAVWRTESAKLIRTHAEIGHELEARQESPEPALVAEPTIAQRIVRAKRTLSEAGVPFEVPRGAEFNEGLTESPRPS